VSDAKTAPEMIVPNGISAVLVAITKWEHRDVRAERALDTSRGHYRSGTEK
jgi:hypothetical protein